MTAVRRAAFTTTRLEMEATTVEPARASVVRVHAPVPRRVRQVKVRVVPAVVMGQLVATRAAARGARLRLPAVRPLRAICTTVVAPGGTTPVVMMRPPVLGDGGWLSRRRGTTGA